MNIKQSLLKLILTLILISNGSINNTPRTCPYISTNNHINQITLSEHYYKINIDTVECEHVRGIIELNSYGLNNINQITSFFKYIKTQSSDMSSELGRKDILFVIQVMLNRIDNSGCKTWQNYFNNPRINNSESIRGLINGRLKPLFSTSNTNDRLMIEMLYMTLRNRLYGHSTLLRQFIIPRNILYFESFKKCPNRGVHRLDKMYCKVIHKFYSN